LGAFGVKPRWRSAVAAAVIMCELATAALLAADVTALAGLGVGAALLIVFTMAISSVLRQGTSASCRCFGASTQPLGRRHLVRNAILLLIAAIGVTGTSPATALGWNPAALLVSGFHRSCIGGPLKASKPGRRTSEHVVFRRRMDRWMWC
jgi:hypothetical protein